MHKERPYSLADAAKFGLYGGIAAIMIALVGMVDAFERKDIIADIVTMSQVLLGAMAFTPAFLAASRAQQTRGKGISLVAGGVAGAVAALLVALLALAIEPLNLRAVFVNATPVLVGELMPGDLEGITGAIVLVAAGLVVGLVAALLTWLPARLRRSTIISLVAVTLIALLADVIAVIIPREVDRYIYRSNGLSVEGAVTLFVVILVIAYLWQVLQPKLNRAVANLPESRRQVLRFVTTIVLLALLFALPALLGSYLSEVADLVGFYIVMALGLNVVVGFAGLLDLGYVAFFAIGAYTMAVLTTPELPLVRSFIPPLSFWAALPLAVLASLLAGVFLGVPVLKTRGDYLAIVTLGFGEIIRAAGALGRAEAA
jgi:branched-chain amino acid transport system permease protein